VTTTNPTSLGRLEALTRAMMARGADYWTARQRAYALLDREILGQASVIAYGRIYVLAAILILLLIPLLLLVRKPRGAAGSHAVME
jgi:DHA2 family multidrug resistance protein